MENSKISISHRTINIQDGKGPFSPEIIEETLKNFSVVSFDVFDTLLFRNLADPKDVFKIIEEKYNIDNFYAKRIAAEALSREKSKIQYDSYETSIDQIYSMIYDDHNKKDFGVEMEVSEEEDLLFPHPFGMLVYKIAKKLGLKTIAISDMYLGSEQIKKILIKNGFYLDHVFSSSDWRKEDIGKYNGKSFVKVCRELNVFPEEIIHFGDNIQSDFINANEKGVASIHLPSAMEELMQDDRINPTVKSALKNMDTLESSLLLGNLSRRLKEGYFGVGYNVARAFGYIQGGLTAAAFLSFMEEEALANGKKALFCLTRDGFTIKQAAEIFGTSIDFRVIWSSRRMCLVPLLAKNAFWVLPSLFPYRPGVLRLSEELKRLHLALPEDVEDFESDNYHDFLKYLESMGSKWREIIGSEANSYRDYLRSEMDQYEDEDIALVDVGWGLTSHKAIDQLLGSCLSGFYLGTHDKAYNNDRIKNLFFSYGEPKKICTALMSAVEILELIFSDASPSAVRVSRSKFGFEPEFEKRDSSDLSRDIFVREVRAGMLDFLKDIAPYRSILKADALKNAAEAVCIALIENPTAQEYSFLGNIPHVREVGKSQFYPISYWWNPQSNADQEEIEKSLEVESLVEEKHLSQESKLDFVAEGAKNIQRSWHNRIARSILTPIFGHSRINKLSDFVYDRN
ncbi:hypothetical protein AD936_18145 [Gluconobacter japonicus]|nr:hypothetical protein AD936_18145 [Gluconobacter japonicus]